MSAIQRAPGPGAGTMALGDLVRWRRGQLGLTQEEIAARDPAGRMTQAEISQYEKSKVARSGRQKLERLAAALGLPYDLVTAATYQPIAADGEVAEFVRRWYAQRDEPAQLPLQTVAAPHERMLADLMAQAQTDPELLRLIQDLSGENSEETYRRTIQIVWRHMVAGLETAHEIYSNDSQDKQRV